MVNLKNVVAYVFQLGVYQVTPVGQVLPTLHFVGGYRTLFRVG